jgi:hypothetical protein
MNTQPQRSEQLKSAHYFTPEARRELLKIQQPPAMDDRVKEQGDPQWFVKKVRLERYTDYELWCGDQWVSSGLQQAPASKIADFINGRHK